MSLYQKYSALLERAATVHEPCSAHSLTGWEIELSVPDVGNAAVKVVDPYGDSAIAFRMGSLHTVLVFPLEKDLIFVEATLNENDITDEWHRAVHWSKDGIPPSIFKAFMSL